LCGAAAGKAIRGATERDRVLCLVAANGGAVIFLVSSGIVIDICQGAGNDLMRAW
jgi:hypothetical protein